MSVTIDPRAIQLTGHDFASYGGGFDPDAYHVMNRRDEALIAQEIIHGAVSSKFTYSFNAGGEAGNVAGISVIGARHLACHYGGLHHRVVSAEDKRGSVIRSRTFAHAGVPDQRSRYSDESLAKDPDYYSILIEIQDIKRGNTIQVEKMEELVGKKRDDTTFPRPHAPTIAQSKAYRNGVLSLCPQDVLQDFIALCLKRKNDDDLSVGLLAEKRERVLSYATEFGFGLDPIELQKVHLAQITGLANAAARGELEFRHALAGLGLLLKRPATIDGVAEPAAARAQTGAAKKGPTPKPQRQPTSPTADPPPPQHQTAAPTPQSEEGGEKVHVPDETVRVAAAEQLVRPETQQQADPQPKPGPTPAGRGRRLEPGQTPSLLGDGFGSGE